MAATVMTVAAGRVKNICLSSLMAEAQG